MPHVCRLSLATAVATTTVFLTSALALHVLEFVHDVLEDQHEGAVGDEVAGAAVSTLTEEVVEPAAGEADEHAVEIGLKQLNLPRMEEEPMMLIVISEALEN